MPLDTKHELARYRKLLAESERDAAILRRLIDAIENEADTGTTGAANPFVEKQKARRAARANSPGRTGLKQILAELMMDGERRDVDAIMEAIQNLAIYKRMPSRVTFTNRLRDLVEEDVLRRVDRGVYELASPDGDAPSLTAEGIPTPDAGGESPPAP